MLILYNVRMDMAGSVDFSAANAKSSAQLRVKGERAPFFITKPNSRCLSLSSLFDIEV